MKLLDGYYKVNEAHFVTWKVDGEKIDCKDAYDTYDYKPTLHYGDFGESHEKIREVVGDMRYNMKLMYYFAMGEKDEKGEIKMIPFTDYGVIVDEGKKVYLKGGAVWSAEKITDEEFASLEDAYDDIEAPLGPYTVQPQNQGKVVWITGAPGSGKSTTAQLLGRLHGFVYYEADCFAAMKNPFVDLNTENPTLDHMKQNFLKGKGAKERSAMMNDCFKAWGKVLRGEDFDKETNRVLIGYYRALAEDIKTQKKRIGGNWAVANVVFNKLFLQNIREVLGEDLICVHLQMEKEDKMKRLLKRHEGAEKFVEIVEAVEKQMDFTENDTELVYSKITDNMTKEDVVHMVMETVKENSKC